MKGQTNLSKHNELIINIPVCFIPHNNDLVSALFKREETLIAEERTNPYKSTSYTNILTVVVNNVVICFVRTRCVEVRLILFYPTL